MTAIRRQLLLAKACGINWTRLHDAGLEYIGWWNLEPEKGKWRFFDREIHRYREHHIHIFAELGTAPPWASYYSTSGKKGFGYFDKFFQPRNLHDYANYVKTVVARYRNEIDQYFVWNEPWIHAWWAVAYDPSRGWRGGYLTSKEPQKDFVKLMKTAYTTARSVNPEAKISGVNTTSNPNTNSTMFSGREWSAGVVAAGGLAYCDMIDYHNYTSKLCGFPGDAVERAHEWALKPVWDKEGKGKHPIYMSEGQSVLGQFNYGLYANILPFKHDENCRMIADRLCRYILSMLANHVQKFFLYSLHSYNLGFGERSKWAVLINNDGTGHPAFAAVSQMAWQLDGATFLAREVIKPGIFAYIFKRIDGKAVAVISSAPGQHHWRLPAGLPWEDLFGNPVPAGAEFDGHLVYTIAETPQTIRTTLHAH